MDELLVYAGIPSVLLIMGIAELLKKIGFNAKFIPLINIFFGLLAGIALNTGDIKAGIFTGLAVGLSAGGLYSGTKNVKEGIHG
jgi:uncharacterized hydantoinase/oxoprolinase family protein